ncbi:pilus assembly protein [Spongiactinospora rosea]|uniref:Pilus assembly protein n=2 Tax=Spongiactinospora rosea TaxID=2248750 RepID=A0A366LJC8_9ACTN|nr:pilus assembly protein [Spongiactinospora rosea]
MTLETAILGPALIAMFVVMIAAGRIAIAAGSIDAAARDAARQASIARGPNAAHRAALSSARQALVREGLKCSPSVTVSTGGFSRSVGTSANVSATVVCDVALADIALPGMPGSKTLRSTFVSPLDPYRGRDDS